MATVECVPNFSEGRNKSVIDSIVRAISSRSVRVLGVEPGEAANRTVVTFTGTPEEVCEAAFLGAAKAQELIDMRLHHGAHPRSGAVDVLPLVPVEGISLEECAVLARGLAMRMWEELGIPCYLYEAAALKPSHRNLADCRAGEYEALSEKLAGADAPDFGPDDRRMSDAILQSGASNVGARNFLIAVNFNLNTSSVRDASAIALAVREKGRLVNGTRVPGSLKGCKAMGWYIDEYACAQVSMNITDISATPLHRAYEEVCDRAEVRGLRVTGTEIIGLVPRSVILDAGRHFLEKKGQSPGAGEDELISAAIREMGLDSLRPFIPSEKLL